MIPPLGKYLTDEELLLCDLEPTDEINPCRNLYLWLFRSLGLLVVSNGQRGRLIFKWMSAPFFYCLSWIFLHLYIIYTAAVERIRLVTMPISRSFEKELFLYSQFGFFLFQGIAAFMIVESGKIVAYYNSLAVFQARHYHVRGDRLNLGFGLVHKYFFLVLILVLFVIFFFVNVINIFIIYDDPKDRGSPMFIVQLISTFLILVVLLGVIMLYLGNVTALSYVISAFLNELTNVFQFGDEKSFDDYESLWIDLMHVVNDLVNATAYTLGYYLVVAVLIATFQFFLAIQQDYINLTVYAFAFWGSMTALHMITDHMIFKMTDNLKNGLIEVRKDVSRERRARICRFFRLIRTVGKRCSLAGFVTFDNSLASSVLNNITTYIIILLQFRRDNQQVG